MINTRRIHIPGGIYHVTQRGNAKKRLFFNNEDRAHFCLLMQKYFTQYHHRVHALCLMDNHIHILVQAGSDPLAKSMQSLTSVYAKRLNKKFNSSGHRFQSRYFSSIIQQDVHLLNVLKYIHMNPVKAGMVQSPSDYFWSTHNYYSQKDNIPWVVRDTCLSMFNCDFEQSINEYNQFMDIELTDDEAKNISKPTQGYIVGNDDFITEVETLSNQINILHHLDVEQILSKVCCYFNYPVESVKRPGKERLASQIRGITGYIVRRHTQISLCELANLTRRNSSSISQSTNKLSKNILNDPSLQKIVDEIMDLIMIAQIKNA